MNNYVIIVCVLLMLLTAVLAFALGAWLTLRYQRGIFRRTGYAMIGAELYRAELVAEPLPEIKAEKRQTTRQNRSNGGLIPQQN